MKKLKLLIFCFAFSIVIAGCSGGGDQVTTITPASQIPTRTNTNTSVPFIISPSETNLRGATATSVLTPVVMPTTSPLPAEAQVTTRCLEVVPKMTDDIVSSGFVLMEKGSEMYSMDMLTGQSTQISSPDEILGDLFISPDQTLLAYRSTFIDTKSKTVRENLVIADARGQQLKKMVWDEAWIDLVGWKDDQHLIFQLAVTDSEEDKIPCPGPWLVLDPFSEEQWILPHDLLPGWKDWLVESYNYVRQPDWPGCSAAKYDPNHTIAVYPHLVEEDTERFTYGIWNIPQQQLITSLESVVNFFVSYNYYPKPSWSPDNSQFALVGAIAVINMDGKAERELFRVSRDGQVEQMTRLEGNILVWPSSHSWSPDGRYIALFLNTLETYNQARLAVLDTVTLELTDYCLMVSPEYGASFPQTPIWSPDGKQILVVDWYGELRSQVILIDMERSLVVQLAGDSEVVGWMLEVE